MTQTESYSQGFDPNDHALLNGITVADSPDLAVNEVFGLKLDGPGWSELAGRRAMVGTLSNQQGVMIKLVALDPYGHWNLQTGRRGHVGVSLPVSPECDDGCTAGGIDPLNDANGCDG